MGNGVGSNVTLCTHTSTSEGILLRDRIRTEVCSQDGERGKEATSIRKRKFSS